jgi:hypothetical protein
MRNKISSGCLDHYSSIQSLRRHKQLAETFRPPIKLSRALFSFKMLTGPIFSQEEEEEMMDFDSGLRSYHASPRASFSQELSRGTVILEGEDDEEAHEAETQEERGRVGPNNNEVFATPPNVIPYEYTSEELQFSFDFSAPTNVDSLQFRQHDEDSAHDRVTVIRGFIKKNCWVAVGLIVALYMGQQMIVVKNDLAALRIENEQLRSTVETLQQEKIIVEEELPQQSRTTILDTVVLTTERIREYIEDELLGPDLLDVHKFEIKERIVERACQAKDQVSRHMNELKHSFWETTERVGGLIEEGLEDLLAPHKPLNNESDNIHFISSYVETVVDQLIDKKQFFTAAVDKTMKQIGNSATKVFIPLLFVSGTSLLVDHFTRQEE